MAETITMYLKHQNDDLYYSMDNVNFSPLEENTQTGVNVKDTMRWELAQNSGILAIKKITVNEDKNGHKAFDIWEQTPVPVDPTRTVFEGLIKTDLNDDPKFNGYTVYYTTLDGEHHRDPEITQPRPGGQGDTD